MSSIKTNPQLVATIDNLKAKTRETEAAIWRDIALRLEKPKSNWAEANLSKLERYAKDGETIMFELTPKAGEYDVKFLEEFALAQEAVMAIRGIRAQKQISPKQSLELFVDGDFSDELLPVLKKAANVSDVHNGNAAGASVSFIVGTVKMSVPLDGFINADEEKAKLTAELEHQKKFLASVRAKLSNEKFVSHAPQAVIDTERKKEADALARIEALEASLNALN